ncbi:50S ribosomal protein L4 [bacterium]|mgnify:CR=1|jgi:large subunit ribosomal protein L4|nr:50S ribosomal protein L4 [bacterium]
MEIKLKKYNLDGSKDGDVLLNYDGKPSENTHQLHLLRTLQKKIRQQGTVLVKGRSDVRGGGAKPYAQKGTGRARRGTSRSPLIVGGGVIFGPSMRSTRYKLNKKQISSAKIDLVNRNSDKIVIINSVVDESLKTKDVAKLISSLLLEKGKVQIVLDKSDSSFERAARNLKNVSIQYSGHLDVEKTIQCGLTLVSTSCLSVLGGNLSE